VPIWIVATEKKITQIVVLKPIFMKIKYLNSLVLAGMVLSACQTGGREHDMEKSNEGTFGFDLAFLKARDSVIVLKNESGDGQLIVSPRYQGKVFTSTAEGAGGKSFGWINYKAFDAAPDAHMNAYGGEDRLWLGPEGGKFSLFFKPGTAMDFEHWHTPPAIDTEGWNTVAASDKKVSLAKTMELLNYAGTTFRLTVERDIEVIENAGIEAQLGIALGDQVRSVAFKTTNAIVNTGTQEWNAQTGAPCLWNLDMLSPSPETVVVIPYLEQASGKVATTDYFGEIPADRIRYSNGILLFRADGASRGKLGIPPQRAKPIAGSYDGANGVLTVTLFDVNPGATYLNQEWTVEKDPFSGDAVNAYNDGPLAGGGQLGPFYEIESVSPAAFLKPGEKLTHRHSVFHFSGDRTQLDRISATVFGISLNEIESAFKK
jgi:hypothetical protein